MEKPLNAAELQREIQDFLRQKYGERVVFPHADPTEGEHGVEAKREHGAKRIDFDLTPDQLVDYLDKYVIGQEQAKEVLATKVCTHFHRARMAASMPDTPVGHIKNNIILIGPTGVGKTYLVRLIAQRLGVPFVKGDATKFSETGYVGGDVEDLVRELVRDADGDIDLAQHGIIYIDEIDKIASSGPHIGPDVSRTGVQRNLLKLMEETEVDLRPPHDLASQMESLMQFQKTGHVERKKISTKQILFIVSGAFSGLDDIVRRRVRGAGMGFAAGPRGSSDAPVGDLDAVTPQDLIEFGFESEFVGRLPVTAILSGLSVGDLLAILRNPNSPVIVGKKQDFLAYGIEIEFEDAALGRIAALALDEKTGARGLVSVMERILMKWEKRLPSTDVKHVKVTLRVVEDPAGELDRLIAANQIQRFCKRFLDDYQVVLSFTEEAEELVRAESRRSNEPIEELCGHLLRDYGLGLKLIGCTAFVVDTEAIRAPKDRLDELIRGYYREHAGESRLTASD